MSSLQDQQLSQKRIVKNTLLLYIRQFITMGISLYTSRLILKNLGVVDYGVYNAVGGIIAMLGFLTNSLGAAGSRFITYNLGVGNPSLLRKTFGNIVLIHLILAGIIVLVSETAGLWFVENKLQIPIDRMIAARWTYQFAIATSVVAIISAPYNAAIIAHERMSAFAYIGILDAVLKLIIAIAIAFSPADRLITYALLFFLMQLLERLIYGIYCSHHFEETHARPTYDRGIFVQLFGFTGWTTLGSLAALACHHGTNILLNLFFGPVVNAARGVAFQVQSAVRSFCQNFQMALNPQLTKAYAQHELNAMHQLLIMSTKFSTYLMFLFSLPVLLEVDQILEWWLVEIPTDTNGFIQFGLWTCILSAINNPIINSVQATGRIKKFQIIEGLCLLSTFPISYILLRTTDISALNLMYVYIIIEILTQIIRIQIVLPMIQMGIIQYYKKTILPILIVFLTASIIPVLVKKQLEENLSSFFIVCSLSVIFVIICSFYIGCSKQERMKVVELVLRKIKKK